MLALCALHALSPVQTILNADPLRNCFIWSHIFRSHDHDFPNATSHHLIYCQTHSYSDCRTRRRPCGTSIRTTSTSHVRCTYSCSIFTGASPPRLSTRLHVYEYSVPPCATFITLLLGLPRFPFCPGSPVVTCGDFTWVLGYYTEYRLLRTRVDQDVKSWLSRAHLE